MKVFIKSFAYGLTGGAIYLASKMLIVPSAQAEFGMWDIAQVMIIALGVAIGARWDLWARKS
ncbi:hypothetical protein MCEMSEM23_02716 [Rhabdaerophilaceae bacterium]